MGRSKGRVVIMTNELEKILVFEESDKDIFRSMVNFKLQRGYKLSCSSCSYDTENSCSMYQAILYRED